jgi:hypothetical protein
MTVSMLVAVQARSSGVLDHIKKVWLHSWSTGRATALYPAVGHMLGPLYQTLTPVHHPLIALAQPESSGA